MKLKLKELHPNPFKKEIDKGKLHQDQIDSIKANLDKLGLMDAIPVVKINGKYHLVSHHHRVEALKQVFGEDYEVPVVEHNYDNETMLRGMVIENISQRSGDFRQIKENLSIIKKQLNENPEWLTNLYIYKTVQDSLGREKHQQTSKGIGYWQIYRWIHNIDTKEKEEYLKENKKAKNQIISFASIQQTIQIDEKLDEELKEQIEKKHDKNQDEREEGIGHTLAVVLSSFDDKEEQKDLAKAIKNSEEGRVREQGHLLSIYKKSAFDEVRELIRTGLYDIKYIELIDKTFSILGPEKVDNKILAKVLSMQEEMIEEYLEGIKDLSEELKDKVLESNLESKDVQKLIEFEEPEQQAEIFDLYEQQDEEDEQLFNDVVDRYKGIADGEVPLEEEFASDPDELRAKKVRDIKTNVMFFDKERLKSMQNERFKKEVIEELKFVENYIHKLLIDIGEHEVLE